MLIERLSKQTGLDRGRLRYFAESASRRYYVFSVPKATGGYRKIAHPARPLKAVQRWLNAKYFIRLPIHDAATAYRKGRGLKANAQPHLAKRFTLRIDFREFFPNFTMLHIYKFLELNSDLLEMAGDDALVATMLVCRDGGLTIGAPTSPVLTNAMMFEFDQMLTEYCIGKRIVYTRYADDLFLSTNEPNILGQTLDFVRSLAESYQFARLRVNSKKTAFLSKKYHREITGLVITPDGEVSIGRKKKRELKALVHKLITGDLPKDRVAYLEGYLNFVRDVEPSFIVSLKAKYGEFMWAFQNFSGATVHTSFSRLEGLDGDEETD
ncbi:retron St85 family RNA-directed DNA polymerase [Qipengyuania sp. MTN3-11]|uniref:retron St85 family RNA-directed DNA polymerase n=1 Tax=Qipengyuania sp. MTN3-11 TaxID=3056557 RepID=UPI0036F1EDBF